MSQSKFQFLAVLIVAGLVSALLAPLNRAVAAETTDSTSDVYLLIGQSNMAGRAKITPAESKPVARCVLLTQDGKWEPATNPLNRHSTIRKGLGMQRLNPGYTFAEEMTARNPKVTIGLVVNAKGGTKVEQWQKGTKFYTDALKRAKTAQQTGTLKGILWHQGESNSGKPEGYLKLLSQLIQDLRTELNTPNLPFVAGEVFYHPKKKANTKAINAEIAKLPGAVPHTAVVRSEGLTTSDNTHFDTSGMRELGRRYAQAMIKLQQDK